MTEEQEREEFERWFLADVPNIRHMLAKDQMGQYVVDSAFHAWDGWQARAKLMLTLPVKDATGEH